MLGPALGPEARAIRNRVLGARLARSRKVPVAVKQYVQKAIKSKGELQSFDVSLSITGSTAGSVNKLTTVAQGDDINNRSGDEIDARTQAVTCQITSSTLGTGAFSNFRTTIVRIIVFQDRHGDSTPTVSGTTNTSVLASASIHANYNLDTTDRYKILYDRRHIITQAPGLTGFEGNKGVALIKFRRNVNHKMEFADTTGVLPAKGQIYILQVLDALATDQVVTIAGFGRLQYKEL